MRGGPKRPPLGRGQRIFQAHQCRRGGRAASGGIAASRTLPIAVPAIRLPVEYSGTLHRSRRGAGSRSMPGTWQFLQHQPAFWPGPAFLLTDGSVFCHEWQTRRWWRLWPNAVGAYAPSSWHPAGQMHHLRLYYSAAMLADGRLFLGGGYWTKNGCRSPSIAQRSTIPRAISGPWSARRSSCLAPRRCAACSPTAGCWWAAAKPRNARFMIRSWISGAAPAVKPRSRRAARRPGPCSPAAACSPSRRNFPSLPSKATSPPRIPGPRAPRHRWR